MESITELWKTFNETVNKNHLVLGRTNNIVGDYAENLANRVIEGDLLNTSFSGTVIEKEGKLYQVKSRRVDEGVATKLGVVRSWNFDYLVVILFDKNGNIEKGVIVPACVVKEVAVENKYQKGYVITAHRNFLNCRRRVDITEKLKFYNGEPSLSEAQILEIKSRKFEKLHKIKKWARSPQQVNYRIIKAYLSLSKDGPVPKQELSELCSSPVFDPKYFVEKFTGNLNSMMTDAGNSHGKIFFEDNGYIYVYPQAIGEIEKYFHVT